MTHDPYANAHPVGGAQWSAEEDAKLSEMLAAGAIRQEIADAMPGRSLSAVKSRIRYKRTPWAQLTEENRVARLKRDRPKYVRTTHRNHVISEEMRVVVPPEVIEERNQRYMAPQDITGWICGDPPRGFSALERRHAANQ